MHAHIYMYTYVCSRPLFQGNTHFRVLYGVQLQRSILSIIEPTVGRLCEEMVKVWPISPPIAQDEATG